MTRYTGEILLSVFLFVFAMLAIFGRDEPVGFICAPCAKKDHCKDNRYCDCAHREPAPPAEPDKKAA